jgi:hypothetical protein
MSTTVFQAKIEELTYFKDEMIAKIVESIFYAVKARSLKYRSEVRGLMGCSSFLGLLRVVLCFILPKFCMQTKWFSMRDLPRSVSPTFCDMLQTLAFRQVITFSEMRRTQNPPGVLIAFLFSLEAGRKRLVGSAFQRIWQKLADCLDTFILDSVILPNK